LSPLLIDRDRILQCLSDLWSLAPGFSR